MSAVASVHMKIEGPKGEIRGESRVKDFAGWIELDDWRWAIGFQAPPDAKGSGTSHRNEEAVPSVLSFSKLMDCATTGMLSAMTRGEVLTVTVSVVEASEEPFRLDILLEHARLTAYDADFKSEEKLATIEESWSLDYRKINFAYAIGSKAGPEAVLKRPRWATTDKPKGALEDEVGKLTDNITPDELEALWKKIKARNEQQRLSPKEAKKEVKEAKKEGQ